MKLEPANIACPVCGNSNYMRHLIGNNIGYYDTKCLNCLSYFNYEEIAAEALDGKDINVTTNADRIRNMTDEDLAKLFEHIQYRIASEIYSELDIVSELRWNSVSIIDREYEWLKKEAE